MDQPKRFRIARELIPIPVFDFVNAEPSFFQSRPKAFVLRPLLLRKNRRTTGDRDFFTHRHISIEAIIEA
jgi:hypothetical protein